jgi:hypothetical protein
MLSLAERTLPADQWLILDLEGNMPLTRRYTPEHPPGESCNFGLDYSFVLPKGVGITAGSLSIWSNTVAPAPADSDWTAGPVAIQGRVIYATLTGGIEGKDYQLRWNCTDSRGNTWPRTTLVLCAQTS